MTRCLNCGAERDADVCEACGLNASAAEFALRKKLLNRTAIFLLGALASVVAAGRYPALDLDEILIFIGVVFFLTLCLAIFVERLAIRHREVEAVKRIYYGLVPVPWLLAGLLFANGAWDRSTPYVETERVISKFSMPGAVRNQRLVVPSWRDGHRIERVPVARGDFDRVSSGDTIDIQMQDGLAGIPWVLGVTHH
jgi:hypothetical protein